MSIDEASVAALRTHFELDASAPVEVDGRRIPWTLRPDGAEALADALRRISERGLAVLVRGGGTRSRFGNPPRRADLVLSTRGLAGVHELDVEEGVAKLGAGTRLADVTRALAGSGWELPLDAAGAESTVGGTLASAAPGPRFVAPRDAVLGLDVALASGARTRCGGRVVKNVTGYDLAKLYVGACGSLGVIESAWLRLRPTPERTLLLAVKSRDPEAALEIARRPTARAALWVGEAGETRLLVELAGDAPAVDGDAEWLGGTAAAPEELDAVFAASDDLELRVRIASRPTRLAAVTDALAAAGARWHALPAHGLCWGRFALAPDAGDPVFAQVCDAARAAARLGAGGADGVSWRIESAPARAKRGRDVFGDSGAGLALMRALKQQFDPEGVLNPGRFAGAL